MSIILLEGPDGSGKSTLANYFINNHKTAYIHVSNPKDYTYPTQQHDTMILFGENWKNSSTVFDRHWLSLLIYSYIFDEQKIQENVIYRLTQNLSHYLDIINHTIICLPPKELYLKKFEELKLKRKEVYTNMNDIYDAYDAIYYGKNYGITDNGVLKNIINLGGLKNMKGVHLYDYTKDGLDIKSYLDSESITLL